MPDVNEVCWAAIGALGAKSGEPLHAGAVERFTRMGLVEVVDGSPRLTAYGECA